MGLDDIERAGEIRNDDDFLLLDAMQCFQQRSKCEEFTCTRESVSEAFYRGIGKD